MTRFEIDDQRTQTREWVVAILAVTAWFLLASNSAQAQTIQVPDIVLAQVLGHSAPPAAGMHEMRSTETMAPVNLVAQQMRSSFEDQLISGVSHPTVELEVHFGFDSADIEQASQPQIEAAAEVLNNHFQGIRFLVAGFTCARGDENYNRDLSERRAAAVWKELVETHGVDAERLERVGYGEEDPNADMDSVQRRRVELQILRGEARSL